MEVFPEKVASLPLPVVEVSPRQPGLPGAARPPLRLTLAKGDYRSGQLAAFAGGQGAADLTWIDEEAGILEVQARRALAPGGQLIVVTDHLDYFHHIRRVLYKAEGFARIPMPRMSDADGEIVGTNFERKYIAQGRPFFATALMRYR